MLCATAEPEPPAIGPSSGAQPASSKRISISLRNMSAPPSSHGTGRREGATPLICRAMHAYRRQLDAARYQLCALFNFGEKLGAKGYESLSARSTSSSSGGFSTHVDPLLPDM